MLLSVITSCDFKPEGYQIYTGKEPVLNLNITDYKNQVLHLEKMRIGKSNYRHSYSIPLNKMDLTPPEYLMFYEGELLKIYTTRDNDDNPFLDLPKPDTLGVLKLVDYNGLNIEGNLSNGLGPKNIVQSSDDRKIINYVSQLEVFEERIRLSDTDFNYENLKKEYEDINTYIQNSIDNLYYVPLFITYLELAASADLISQDVFIDKCSCSYNPDEFTGKRLVNLYYGKLIDLPFFSPGHELKSYEITDDYVDTILKNDSDKIKIIINDSNDENEKLQLLRIKSNIEENYSNEVSLLTIPYGKNIIQVGNIYHNSEYYKLLQDNKRAKFYPKTKPLTTIIIDKDNTVLLNTMADDDLELKVESILEYLEKQDVVED